MNFDQSMYVITCINNYSEKFSLLLNESEASVLKYVSENNALNSEIIP